MSVVCCAQVKIVTGSVTDTLGKPLPDIFITLLSNADSLSSKTNNAGNFIFKNKVADSFTVVIEMVEFEKYSRQYILTPSSIDSLLLDPIMLKVSVKDLQEIVLTTSNPVTIKEDTIEYRADAYKVREGSVVEDLLKKLPGISIDREGNVSVQGKEIQAVRINGKDYFGGDVKTATQNLPAGIVENIQVIDDYGDKAKHTGIKSGDADKIININLKKDKNKGGFGNATLAAGTHDRYLMNLSANKFSDEKQLSFVGTINNINANGYEFNGGSRAMGGRNTNPSSGTTGINQLTSLAMNFRTGVPKKYTSYGSYSLTSRENSMIAESYLQDFNPINVNTIKSNNRSQSVNHNQRLTWTHEYHIDTINYLKIFPFISSSNAATSQQTAAEFKRPTYYTLNNGTTQNDEKSPSWGTDIFYLHKFKKGKTLSVAGNSYYNSRDQHRDVTNDYLNVDSSSTPSSNYVRQNQVVDNTYSNTRTGFTLSFAQPISKTGFLEATYAKTTSGYKSVREVADVDYMTGLKTLNLNQSNEYKYLFITNRLGLSLSTRKKRYNVYVGIAAQPSLLTGTDVRRSVNTTVKNFNIIPSARIGYKFAQSNTLTASYNGSSREPGFNQLQPVSDSSNLKNIITGNPNLQPEFTNRFSLQYNKAGLKTGKTLFANISVSEVRNRIVSTRFNDASGTGRTTSFVNANGFHGVNASLSFSKPFAKKKVILSLNNFGSFDNNISFTDNQRNAGNNWSFRPGINVRIDLPDRLDVNFGSSFIYNKNTTRYPTYSYTSKVKTLQFAIDGRCYFLKDWTIGYDLTKSIFMGYLQSFNTNPLLLNMQVERRFMKNNKGLIRLQGFDLFNENTGIVRTVNGTSITDAEVNRLNRYFMVSFNYKLQKFGN